MFLLLMAVLLLTGCWDRRELEERVSILAIGIDRVPENKHLLKISVQIPIPIKIAGSGGQGGGSSESAVQIMYVTGRSMGDAWNKLQERLNQRIFLGHTRIVAISEEVAREGLQGILDSFRRDPQIRRLLWPIVVKGEASRLLEIRPKMVQIPAVYLMELIENGTKTGMFADQTLGNFFIETSNRALNPYLNYVSVEENEVNWKGLAVFRDYKMAGILEDMPAWVVLQIGEKKRGGDIIVPLSKGKGYATFRPHFVQTKLEILHQRNRHAAVYRVELQGDIVETTVESDVKQGDYVQEMQRLVKEEMQKRAARTIRRLQQDFRSDILKLGQALRAYHYRDYWVKHDWHKEFPDFPVRVEYLVKIRRLGMEMK